MKLLNLRQARFVSEYPIDLNASAAAVRAGYKARSAHTVASRLMKWPQVAAALAEGQRQLLSRVELTAEMVLRQTMRIAFADIGKRAVEAAMEPSGTRSRAPHDRPK